MSNSTDSLNPTQLLNRVAQGNIPFEAAVGWFDSIPEKEQLSSLGAVAFMCGQAYPQSDEFEKACALGELDPTHIPCTMFLLEEDMPIYCLDEMLAVPPEERRKIFRFILALFCVADTRRRQTECQDGCHHWWHNLDSNVG
jgi:hypothetical protein